MISFWHLSVGALIKTGSGTSPSSAQMPSFLLFWNSNVRYPRFRFEYFLCRFARRLAPSLTMVASDRTQQALSIELVDVRNRPFLVPQIAKNLINLLWDSAMDRLQSRSRWFKIELDKLYWFHTSFINFHKIERSRILLDFPHDCYCEKRNWCTGW